MQAQPSHDREIDALTTDLLEAVEQLRAQLADEAPGSIIRLRTAVIRDLADHLHAAIEEFPAASLIIRTPRPSDPPRQLICCGQRAAQPEGPPPTSWNGIASRWGSSASDHASPSEATSRADQ